MSRLMIFGATGYTGRIAACHAKRAGLDLVLAGRGGEGLDLLGAALDAETREFPLHDAEAIDAVLHDVAVLLNCAGPFQHTAEPLMAAAIRSGVHYLNIAAELDSYRLAGEKDADAIAARVMLLPGSGGSVAMLGSLAGRAAETIEQPVRIQIALRVAGSMSRGSAISAAENLSAECLERVDGVLVARDSGKLRDFDFGDGPVACFPVTLPDLVTIWKAGDVPNIGTFVHIAVDAFPTGELSEMPDGPSAVERHANRYQASVEVTGADGTPRVPCST